MFYCNCPSLHVQTADAGTLAQCPRLGLSHDGKTLRSSSPPHLKHLHSPSCDIPFLTSSTSSPDEEVHKFGSSRFWIGHAKGMMATLMHSSLDQALENMHTGRTSQSSIARDKLAVS
jgi:hypothetical protein